MRHIIFIVCILALLIGCNSESIKEIKYTKNILNETLPLPIVNKYSGTYKSSIFVYGGVKTTRPVYVHYTLDGSEPVKLKSAWLGGGITISKSCTLKIKGFVSNTNECSPTLTLNYVIGTSFTPEIFTYQNILYKGRTNIGTGDCTYNTFDTLTISEPKVSNFECEGYFTLKGNYSGTGFARYMCVTVFKENTLYDDNYYIEGLNFEKRIWLRYGAGNYIVKIYPAPIHDYTDFTKDPEYITSPQSAYPTHWFNIKNNRNEDGIFKYPSYAVQSDESIIKERAISVLTKANKLNSTTKSKSLYLMFYVLDTLTYDYQSAISINFRKQQDALYCMNTGNAVCEGYSNLYGALLRSIGIKAKVVRNKTHAWNEVQDENGSWFLVDCTYNDTNITGCYSQTKFWLSDLTANGENIKTDDRICK
jgi:hypothetical protein